MYWGSAEKCSIPEELAAMTDLGEIKDDKFYTPEFGKNVFVGAITTDAAIDCSNPNRTEIEVANSVKLTGRKLRTRLEVEAEKNLVTMFGVASPEAFKDTAEDLKQAVNESELGESVIDGAELTYHGPYKSKIIRENKRLKLPGDYLKDAKSVIVLGMHFPSELIENSGLDETQQVGTYAFHQYQTCFELRMAAGQVADTLYAMGYKVAITENMLGIGSLTDTPRGRLPDARSNAIEAMAAGLGEVGKSGALLTQEYGPHQRRIVIVTDAELPTDGIYQGKKLCKECNNCIEKCPMQAFEEKTVPVRIGGISIDYPVVERHRCDWSKMYSLCSEEGPGLIGNNTNVKAPEGKKLSIDDLAEACMQKDPIMSRTCVLETCLRHCKAG
jgi:epoxyqueuosine reductase QueG